MLTVSQKYFDRFYWFACLVVFVIVILRCIYVPFAHDEVATFLYYIQRGEFLPFLSHVDANNHFLTSALSWLSFIFFGSSTLALRLPSIVGFIILCCAVFKVNKLFTDNITKIVFSSSFLLAFNFINFYSLCRGYGISMSFLILALYYFYKYASGFIFNHLLKFVLFSQLAISANLTLVLVIAFLTGILMLFQRINKDFFRTKNILLLLFHFLLLFFWVKYAFFLKENGALYAGAGDSYWKITFETLIETIFFKSVIANVIVLLLFLWMFCYFCIKLYKESVTDVLKNPFTLFYFSFLSFIVLFFLLKKLFNINYPEDRIGLFFYVFFILSLCFMINEQRKGFRYYFLTIPLIFATHFLIYVNISIHAWQFYETIPPAFFEQLKEEQTKAVSPITVAGHRLTELFYGFYNYNSPTKLNHITSPEALQPNCDYAVAYKKNKPFYDKFYSELASDSYWGFVLLKRRVQLDKKLIYSIGKPVLFSSSNEYYNVYEKMDTTFNTINPLLAEFTIDIDKAPVPFNAWLVLEASSADDDKKSFSVRIPLNLIKYDWNGTKNFTTCIVSGNIPSKIKRMVVYLWNINKKEIDIEINSFKLYQLSGDGVTEVSPIKR